jgi:hypothetical protein
MTHGWTHELRLMLHTSESICELQAPIQQAQQHTAPVFLALHGHQHNKRKKESKGYDFDQ